VEAFVKAAVVFVFGVATTLTGAFIRSCQTVPTEFFQAWCGAPPQDFAAMQHAHCPGCVLVAAGMSLVALSPMFGARTPQRVRGLIGK